jgi:hypothetical protein
MIDPFKFTEYPLWVRVFIVLWSAQTLLLFILPLFVKPSPKETFASNVDNVPSLQPPPTSPALPKDKASQSSSRKGGNGFRIGKGVHNVTIIDATAEHNGNNGILVEQGATDIKIINPKTNFNKNNGISVEKPE